jgi:hypothetical protein
VQTTLALLEEDDASWKLFWSVLESKHSQTNKDDFQALLQFRAVEDEIYEVGSFALFQMLLFSHRMEYFWRSPWLVHFIRSTGMLNPERSTLAMLKTLNVLRTSPLSTEVGAQPLDAAALWLDRIAAEDEYHYVVGCLTVLSLIQKDRPRDDGPIRQQRVMTVPSNRIASQRRVSVVRPCKHDSMLFSSTNERMEFEETDGIELSYLSNTRREEHELMESGETDGIELLELRGDHDTGIGMGPVHSVDDSEMDDSNSNLPMPSNLTSEEEQALPEFDAPQPEAAAGSSASAVWKTLASTSLTKMKAAKFGRVDV